MSNTEKLLTALIEGGDVSEFECQSRIETLLKRCCLGEGCDDLEPKSRIEILLKQLSVKLASGGSVEEYDGTVEVA